MGTIFTKIKDFYNDIINPNHSLTAKEWLELRKQFEPIDDYQIKHIKDKNGVFWIR